MVVSGVENVDGTESLDPWLESNRHAATVPAKR
jgi:hypothetical protein